MRQQRVVVAAGRALAPRPLTEVLHVSIMKLGMSASSPLSNFMSRFWVPRRAPLA